MCMQVFTGGRTMTDYRHMGDLCIKINIDAYSIKLKTCFEIVL